MKYDHRTDNRWTDIGRHCMSGPSGGSAISYVVSEIPILYISLLPSDRQHLNNYDCLEHKREDYHLSNLVCAQLCITAVHSDVHTHWSSS